MKTTGNCCIGEEGQQRENLLEFYILKLIYSSINMIFLVYDLSFGR